MMATISRNELLAAIDEKRGEMVETGMKEGLLNPNTIRLSQELDGLLNDLHKMDKERKNNAE